MTMRYWLAGPFVLVALVSAGCGSAGNHALYDTLQQTQQQRDKRVHNGANNCPHPLSFDQYQRERDAATADGSSDAR
ncbi:MAG: hypothetical protein ACYC18_11275 [Gammaproteobacteria bacterium]